MILSTDIGFYDFARRKNELWFVNVYYGAICVLDLESSKLDIEFMFPEEYFGIYKYTSLAFYEDTLVIAPRNDNRILFYDIKKKEISVVVVSEDYIPDHLKINLFYKVEIYENFAYFFPGRYGAILKIDLKDRSVSYLSDWAYELKKTHNKNSVYFNQMYREKNGVCYLASFQSNEILLFDLKTEKWRFFKTEIPDSEGFISIMRYGESQYLLSTKEKFGVYMWNSKEQKVENVACKLKIAEVVKNIIVSEDYIYIMGNKSHLLYRTDRNFLKEEKIIIAGIWKKYDSFHIPTGGAMCAGQISEEKELLCVYGENSIGLLDKKSGEMKWVQPVMDEKQKEQIQHRIDDYVSKNFMQEQSFYGLTDFLSLISNNSNAKAIDKSENDVQIYKKLMGE